MCFTIHVYSSRSAIEKRFQTDASVLHDFEFRYFYKAFDKPYLPVISQNNPGEVMLAQWGLIPFWVKDFAQAEKIRNGTFNARGESLGQKPSFRDAYKRNRCWVLVSGFYEWQHQDQEKIPWFIQLKDKSVFAMAGLLSEWTDPSSGEIIPSFSIVTTSANQLMAKIHNTKKRMPLILDKETESDWLNRDESQPEHIIKPFPEANMDAYTIGKEIGRPDANPLDQNIIKSRSYRGDGTLF